MPESRADKDRLLQGEYDCIREKGTDYVPADRIKSALRGEKLKFRRKPDNIAGLQLCDLLAHPSHLYVRERMGHKINRSAFCQNVCNYLIKQKYDRSGWGTIRGYGYKHLP